MVEDLFESAIRQDINKVLKENGWNSFSDKNLLHMTKKTLIEIIRMLENNWCCSIERHKNTIAYAEDTKANCDLAIEGRDVKIMELEKKLEQTEKDLADYQFNYPTIKELEKDYETLQTSYNILKDNDEKIIKEMGEQIEKMKCCENCKYGYCGWSSESIIDGKRQCHAWNKEKEEYCDIGYQGKYQCWELKE